MSADSIQEALSLLSRFEQRGADAPQEAERLTAGVFRACGQDVTESGFVQGDSGVDCFFRTMLEGRPQLIGVEVKATKRPSEREAVEYAFRLRNRAPFDRVMIVSSAGFSKAALDHADAIGLGVIDLLAPNDLRNWIFKFNSPSQDEVPNAFERIIRKTMQDLAKEIAKDPQRLWDAEWRDLERILFATFEGLGFDARLTRPAKDGGFDIELTTSKGGLKQTFLVEVKHWMDQKPGAAHLRKLIRVIAQRQATGGLLLSSSGFTKTICSGITEYTAPVRLAESNKIISLCKTYYRLSSALWLPLPDPESVLFAETRGISQE
jgi:predicted Mrr-cat superfamily restriction endonuclease